MKDKTSVETSSVDEQRERQQRAGAGAGGRTPSRGGIGAGLGGWGAATIICSVGHCFVLNNL